IVIGEGEEIKPIRAGDEAGRAIIGHSAAHDMADAVQRLYPGTTLTIGPATATGFYYDGDTPDGAFTDADHERSEAEMQRLIAGNHPYVREVVTRGEAHALFAKMGETYKRELIDAMPEGEEISLYRHGAPGSEWVDLCEGPHVP